MSELKSLSGPDAFVVEDNDAIQNASASSKRKARKQDKKLGRKQAQYRKVLGELGVEFSADNTPYLFVANGGLDNGVDRESLVTLFSKYGVLQRVVMQKHKAYALVEFCDARSAQRACVELNGVVMDVATMSSRSPLYLLAMSAMPRHGECEAADGGAEFFASRPPGLHILPEFISEDEERRLAEFFGTDIVEAEPSEGNSASSGCSSSAGCATRVKATCTESNSSSASHVYPDSPLQTPSGETLSSEKADGGVADGCHSVQGSLKHRRVRHYGYEFRYGSNDVDASRPLDNHPGSVSGLPRLLDDVLRRMTKSDASSTGKPIVCAFPDQLTVNDYQPGQGIPPHVDTSWAFEDSIISLSLLSSVVMEFRHADGRWVPVWLPRRSLLVMSGESRYNWSHGITPRKVDCIPASLLTNNPGSSATECSATSSPSQAGFGGLTLVPRDRRISLTFRKIIKDPQRPTNTESSADRSNSSSTQSQFQVPTSDKEAAEMETKHVYEVYDCIASHFSSTRHTPWPRVVDFLSTVAPGSFVLDVGCGNGKYMNVNPSTVSIGCDRSIGLTKIAYERDLNVAVADILNLPYREGFFDACICIAVVHHLVTRERRLNALRQLLRVTRPGGRVLVYVWAQEQEKSATKGRKKKEPSLNADVVGNGCSDKKGAAHGHAGIGTEADKREAQRTNFQQQDVLVPWKFAEPGKKKPKSGDAKEKSRTSSCSSAGNGSDVAASSNSSAPGETSVITSDSASTADGSVTADAAEAGGSAAAAGQSGEVYQRFYHVFVRSELRELCDELLTVATLADYYHDKGNWCAVLEKR
ncbi:alkylated DNA repair protein alkB homolog 8-like [Sycon ciliatum]|uniref:alkylated DNA repair protein alkB homolog 8-like n=1 Tax=Sycon ciliatum TaxID=27933 RepID=UPI0031F635D9